LLLAHVAVANLKQENKSARRFHSLKVSPCNLACRAGGAVVEQLLSNPIVRIILWIYGALLAPRPPVHRHPDSPSVFSARSAQPAHGLADRPIDDLVVETLQGAIRSRAIRHASGRHSRCSPRRTSASRKVQPSHRIRQGMADKYACVKGAWWDRFGSAEAQPGRPAGRSGQWARVRHRPSHHLLERK
jgi:hypothetical protein